MSEEEMKKLVQAIGQALQSGEDPQAIAQAVAQETGSSPEEAMQMVEEVKAMMNEQGGRGQGAGPQDGSGQGGSISAEQAKQAFEQLGLTGEQAIQVIQIIGSMDLNELDKLIQMLSGQGQPQEAPVEEQGYEEY